MASLDIKSISKLSVQERLDLVERIWESIDKEAIPFTDNQWREIQRRLQHHREHPETALSYKQMKAKLRSIA